VDDLTERLTAAAASALSAVRSVVAVHEVSSLPDNALLATVTAIEDVGRAIDALRVATAAEVVERSRPSLGSDRLSRRKGCRNGFELLARLTQVAERTAVARARLGAGILPRESLIGESLPPKRPIVAQAMDAGTLGLDSATAIAFMLNTVADRAEPGMLAAAEESLVGSALGVDAETGEQTVPFTADQTRVQAVQWQAALDPDGVKADEERARVGRGITKTGSRGGLIRYRMELLPEIAGRLERIFDSCLTPKVTGRFLTAEEQAEALVTGDDRTPAQQRHDVFAAVLDAASRSAELPTIGGAFPTVLVSVGADELASGSGAGWIDGIEEPVSIDAVKQFACTGGVQKGYFAPDGRLLALGSPERGFTPQQRRGITLRDGGCLIPGCTIPAGWCEVHHVEEYSRGGPTHTDNGVLLCWHHHHTIETSGWEIQMRTGVPYVRPPVWIDREREWRRATKARTRPGARQAEARGTGVEDERRVQGRVNELGVSGTELGVRRTG
jgi:hypothetical protein